MKLTKNFSLDEFIYSDFFGKYQDDVVDSFNNEYSSLLPNIQKLSNNLQVLRDFINKPIHINISYRPKWWEIKQGRSGLSKHCLGIAADIVVYDLSPNEVADAIECLISDGNMLQGGLGVYDNFVHYDIRKTKARW